MSSTTISYLWAETRILFGFNLSAGVCARARIEMTMPFLWTTTEGPLAAARSPHAASRGRSSARQPMESQQRTDGGGYRMSGWLAWNRDFSKCTAELGMERGRKPGRKKFSGCLGENYVTLFASLMVCKLEQQKAIKCIKPPASLLPFRFFFTSPLTSFIHSTTCCKERESHKRVCARKTDSLSILSCSGH